MKRPAPVARKLRRLGELLKRDSRWRASTDLLAAAQAARERLGRRPATVNCAADRPNSRWKAVTRESSTAPFGPPIDNEFLTNEFCRAVGYNAAPVEFARPVSSSAPTLLLTGSLDATNPVENARDVARSLANAVLLEVENAAHEALPAPVVQDVIVDFLRGADVRGRRIVAAAPNFATVEETLRPRPQRGR